MRCNAINVMVGLFVAAMVCMTGCGGGGSDAGGGGASSTVGVTKQGVWKGLYSSIAQTGGGPSRYTDIQVSGSAINKMYVDDRAFGVLNNTRPQAISLFKASDFTGNAYQSSDGNIGVFFDNSGNHMGMVYGSNDVAVYQHDSMPKVVPKKEDINGVWHGSIFFKSNRDGKIYQSQTDVTCHYQVCTFDQGTLVKNFVSSSSYGFYPEGMWYGGYGTTALMSGDLQFMIMPMCWASSPSNNGGFFDICQVAVLSKISTPANNTANAGTGKSVSTYTTVSLDGSGSQSESGSLTYRWRIISMPIKSAATLSTTSAANPSFTTDRPGEYVIGLIVSDSGFESTESVVTITATVPFFMPPQLENLTATGAVNSIVLTWRDPNNANIDNVEIWRNTVNDLGTAQPIATPPTVPTEYIDTPPYETPFSHDYYYWIRVVSTNGYLAPFNKAFTPTSARPLNAP